VFFERVIKKANHEIIKTKKVPKRAGKNLSLKIGGLAVSEFSPASFKNPASIILPKGG